jgi:hypothetical protein
MPLRGRWPEGPDEGESSGARRLRTCYARGATARYTAALHQISGVTGVQRSHLAPLDYPLHPSLLRNDTFPRCGVVLAGLHLAELADRRIGQAHERGHRTPGLVAMDREHQRLPAEERAPPVCKTGADVTAAASPNPEIRLAHGYATRIPEQLDARRLRLLAVTSAVNDLSAFVSTGDIQEAFFGPIIDHNGNFVFYEILIDKHELDYIWQSKLYSIAGQQD